LSLRERASFLLIPKSVWVDACVLGSIIIICNSVFAPRDIGWLNLSPTPYFLLPILLGCRYGFASGLLGGIVGAGVVLFGLVQSHGLTPGKAFQDYGYLIGALPFIGGICGEIQGTFRKRLTQLTALQESSVQRLKALDSDLYLLREAKAELERMLTIQDSELSTLDAELRRLFDSEGEELYQNILLLFNRQARVTDAGIYLLDGRDEIVRQGLLGSAEYLPDRARLDSIEMAALAVENRTPVSIPDFWNKTEGAQRSYLICTPLLDSAEKPIGVFIVTGMPFINLNRKTVHLISLICRWAARIIEIRENAEGSYRIVQGFENQRVFTTDFFKKNVQLASESALLHSLPSTVVLFRSGAESKAAQSDFETGILPSLRGGDFSAQLGEYVPNLAVLLPLTGERGANIFLERIRFNFQKLRPQAVLESELFVFDPRQGFEDFWQGLMQYVEKPGRPN
jgi:hypothetical protein